MVKSAALVYAIFIMLIVISTVTILIYSVYLNRQVLRYFQKKERIYDNLESAIAICLGSDNLIAKNDSTAFSLFGLTNDSVAIKHEYWGCFNLFTVYSFSGKMGMNKCGFSGSFYKAPESFALYLADRGFPLSVAGKTSITGNCYLPSGGIHKSFVNGHYFEGTEPIKGKIFVSKDTLPSLSKELIENCDINGLKEFYLNREYRLENLPKKNKDKPYLFSFYGNPHVYYQKNSIYLSDLSINGKFVFISDGKIEIDSTCQFNDIIVSAPIITINSGFAGSIQCIAYDSITIMPRCNLMYPSLLMINRRSPDQSNDISPGINIQEHSIIYGWVISKTQYPKNQQSVIRSSATCKIIGGIYADGLINFQGILYGQMITNGFKIIGFTTTYENHIYNGVIDLSMLPDEYVHTGVIPNSNQQKIIKWLH